MQKWIHKIRSANFGKSLQKFYIKEKLNPYLSNGLDIELCLLLILRLVHKLPSDFYARSQERLGEFNQG